MKALAIFALCGCDAFFGLSHVPAQTPDAPPPVDAGPRTIHCDYLWRVIRNDSMGIPMQTLIASPPGYIRITHDGTDLALGGDGSFEFDTPSGAPYELDDTTVVQRSHFIRDSDTCHLESIFYHRMDGGLPTLSTPVNLTPTTPASNNGFVRITSTGLRTFAPPTYVPATNTWSVDWAATTLVTGEPAPLLSAAAGDRMFWVHFTLVGSAYYALDQASEFAVTMVNGVATNIAGFTPATPTPVRCVHVQTNNLATSVALAAAAPRGSGATAASWGVADIPSVADGPGEPSALALTATGKPIDDDLQVAYSNPYPGETEVLETGLSVLSTLASGAAAPIPVYGTINVYALVQADISGACNATVTVASSPIALVDRFTVAGTMLGSDHQAISIDRSQPVPVSLELTSGPRDEVYANLYEVTAQNGTTVLSYLATYYPIATAFTVDPSLLLVGHEYLVVGATRIGVPLGVSKFDYRTFAYPFVASGMPSTSFRIAN